MNLADLQMVARNGHLVEVAALLGVPMEAPPAGPKLHALPVSRLYDDSPSRWLGSPADVQYRLSAKDVDESVRLGLLGLYPDEEDAPLVEAVLERGARGTATPRSKQIAAMAENLRKTELREIGVAPDLRHTTAGSMKKEPRVYAPNSSVVTRDARGDLWSEDGVLLSEEEGEQLLRELVIPE
jgi:hypothetical protein